MKPLYLILLLTLASCKKDVPQFREITFEFSTNVSGNYAGEYTSEHGLQTLFEFTGKSWTKTIPVSTQKYIIQVFVFRVPNQTSTLRVLIDGRVVKAQVFTEKSVYLEYKL
jgi:hypothetical protein